MSGYAPPGFNQARFGQARIGIDLGGSKIEIAAMLPDGSLAGRRRIPTPALYDDAVRDMANLVRETEAMLGVVGTLGVGIPGTIDPETGLVHNPTRNPLNGHPFDRDLGQALGRLVRVENDANCFALSEARDGAGAGGRLVFGGILGTGCGAGIVIDHRIIEGRHRIAGEWGHTPLPWPRLDEVPGPSCWCGRNGCLEQWISGTALARDCDGPGARDARGIPARAEAGDEVALAALARHADRVARGLGVIVTLLDPDVIVLGGGASNMPHLYAEVPRLLGKYAFGGKADTPIRQAAHGDSSGVRGAAWLWGEDAPELVR